MVRRSSKTTGKPKKANKTTGKSTKGSARAIAAPPKLKSGEVIVRMYRQGLGDCFMVFFRRLDGKPFKLMIDCGVITGTAEPEKKMQAVVRNIIASTNGFVDVLVVTHEHWDHVSGFTQAADLFSRKPEAGKLAVGEVWLAWTEDADDATAQALQGGLKNLLNKVRKVGGGLKRLAAETESLEVERARAERLAEGYEEVLGFFGLGKDEVFASADTEGGNRSRAALEAAAGLGKVRHFTPGEKPWTSAELPGVRIFTLGPPKEPEALRRTDPGAQGYHMAFAETDPFSAALAGYSNEPGHDDVGRPFDDNWGLALPSKEPPFARASPAGFIQRHYLNDFVEDDVHQTFEDEHMLGSMALDQSWRRIETDWVNEAAQLALQLDGYTNNTSLVLAIELSEGGPVLLFVGDAQAGNWLSWEKLSWRVDGRVVTANDLVARTCFYKVGHHGSHNATLKGFGLELMARKGIVAFVPVDRPTARKKRWLRMPLPSIMDKLEEMTEGRTVLSEVEVPPNERSYLHEGLHSEFSKNDLYVEVRLPMR